MSRWTAFTPHGSKAAGAMWQATTSSTRSPVAERSRSSSRSTVIAPRHRIFATRMTVPLLGRRPRAGKRVSDDARRPGSGTQPPRARLSAMPAPAQRRCHSYRHPGFAAFAVVVTVLLHGLGPPLVHAQDTWQGSVEVSTGHVDARAGTVPQLPLETDRAARRAAALRARPALTGGGSGPRASALAVHAVSGPGARGNRRALCGPRAGRGGCLRLHPCARVGEAPFLVHATETRIRC